MVEDKKKLSEIGPKYGYNQIYNLNPRKCVLIFKNKDMQLEAQELFSECGIKITTKENVMLELRLKQNNSKMNTCNVYCLLKNRVKDDKLLAEIAWSQLQSAYVAMAFAVQHSWKFAQRTIPEIAEHLKVLEFEINHTLSGYWLQL